MHGDFNRFFGVGIFIIEKCSGEGILSVCHLSLRIRTSLPRDVTPDTHTLALL